jgi:alpha,alpha-trehalase
MLDKAKQQLGRPSALRFSLFKSQRDLKAEEVQEARDYIKSYWHNLERYNPKDEGSLIGLPYPYLVPSYAEGHEFDYNEMYYWDSYFMVQGMFDEEHKELVMGILENMIFLFKRFHIVPNGSQLYYVSRTQPPFMSSLILEIYDAFQPGTKWLKAKMAVAEEEYDTVWMGTTKPNARKVYEGLSRYYDFNYLHDLTEAESGWDYTPRFNRKALNYLPIDLNSLLYKYEMDFKRTADILGDTRAAARWQQAADHRKRAIDRLMWDESRNLYYDYNYVKERRGNVSSLAGFFPMWAGMVTDNQAKLLVKSLKRFEHKGGLSTTDNLPLGQLRPGAMPTQWAYPNGWAPLQLIVIQGLTRYGYYDDAKRIAMRWMRGNLQWYNEHKEFIEKYNVVSPEKPPAKGVYPSQTGFGWTNAVFERLCQDFIDKPYDPKI